jgi:hypothetical protein
VTIADLAARLLAERGEPFDQRRAALLKIVIALTKIGAGVRCGRIGNWWPAVGQSD